MKTALLLGVLLVSCATFARGAMPDSGSGMGSAQPHAEEVAQSGAWHVYRFEKEGVGYFQINDSAGQVHVGFADISGEIVILPMGTDGASATVASANSTSSGEVVYQGHGVSVSVSASSAGTTTWMLSSTAKASTTLEAVSVSANNTCDPNTCPVNRTP